MGNIVHLRHIGRLLGSTFVLLRRMLVGIRRLSRVVRWCLMVLEYINLPLCIGYHRILVRIAFRFGHTFWDRLSEMGTSFHQFLCF